MQTDRPNEHLGWPKDSLDYHANTWGTKVHRTAFLGRGVCLGPFVTIRAHAHIGTRARIRTRTRIHPGVNIPAFATVGAAGYDAASDITQHVVVILSDVYNATLTEYGIRIGCAMKTPEEWRAANLRRVDGPDRRPYRDTVAAVCDLWESLFEWLPESEW